MPDIRDHCRTLIPAFSRGQVIPFMGSGVNLCERPQEAGWSFRGTEFLPSGDELAGHLAATYGYPPSAPRDLARVSQFIAVMQGLGPLYEELHSIFDSDYTPTPLHRFFATLPARLRATGGRCPYQVIVTTNYDDVLEAAFRAAGEPFDLVTYIADGGNQGKFVHQPPEGEGLIIERPNEYRGLDLGERTAILKIHGAVDRGGSEDSYVITEDHYIDYLARTDISNLIPVQIAAKLRRSHFLFMGYGLRDWNLRVILHRIWGEQRLSWKSWAIQIDPDPIDEEFWRKRDVEILRLPLAEYIQVLEQALEDSTNGGGGQG